MLHRSLALLALLMVFTGCATTSTQAAQPSATGDSAKALAAYERPGFVVKMDDGRLWVFQEGSKELADYEKSGSLARHVVRPAAGPNRITIKSPDAEIIDSYLYSKPGFVVKMDDGRLWVFQEGSKELADYEKSGSLAKHVVRPAAGPNRITIKSPDAEIIDSYLYSKPGFVVKMDDGRLWVFQEGSKELADYERTGNLARHVVRPFAGPNRITIRSPDAEIIDAYLRASN